MTTTIPTAHLPPRARILVVGGGITGLSAAIEAAEAGCDVVLVERQAQLGGRVAQMYQYFPKLCPPVCGLEINLRRMRTSPRIQTFTLAEVETVTGVPGKYRVVIRQQPRFVAERCSACGKCAEVCHAERPSAFDFGMKPSKAAYLAYPGAWPTQYTIDPRFCLGTPHPDPLPTPWGEGEKIRPPRPANRGRGRGEASGEGASVASGGWQEVGQVPKLPKGGAGAGRVGPEVPTRLRGRHA